MHFRQSEIEDLRVAAIGDEEVRGFDVAMDDSLSVGGFQRIGRLNAEIQEFVRGDRPLADSLLQRLPFQQLHHDHRLMIVFFHVINRADIWVVQGGSGASLAFKAGERPRVLNDLFRQEF
jgi:hypothetical protein